MADIRDNLPSGLLADIKNYLSITWTDAGTDAKIANLIAQGIVYLGRILGESNIDYTEDSEERMLLFEYVRYARAEALDVFENNYLPLLLGAVNERQLPHVD